MKRSIFLGLLILLGFLFNSETTFAFSQFAGKIVNTKASQIEMYESAGYTCYIPGTSFSLLPIGSPTGTPTDYIITHGVIPKTGGINRIGQLIIGKYIGITSVLCVYPSTPPLFATVMLHNVMLFGTSL